MPFMADLPPCPRIDLSLLAQFNDAPGVMSFGTACLPGRGTLQACPADALIRPIVVTWDQLNREGWTAPGGNRYWQTSIPADPNDPRARAIFELMAAQSRNYYQSNMASGKNGAKKMSAVLSEYAGRYATEYGRVRVPVMPDPNETSAAFVKRGGFLLWVDPAVGLLRGKRSLQSRGAQPWMSSKVRSYQLWATYDIPAQRLNYAVRVEMASAWSQAVNSFDGWIRKSAGSLCAKANDPAVVTAAVAASSLPGGQAYTAAHGAFVAVCTVGAMPPVASQPRCAPQPPPPGVTLPPMGTGVIITGGGGKPSWSATGTGVLWPGGPQPTGVLAPTPATPPTPPTPAYPFGSIAWYDPTVRGYRIALPQPGNGTTHTPVTAGVLANTPKDVSIVDKATWERATLPWVRRSRVKTSLMVGGIGFTVLATLIASRR